MNDQDLKKLWKDQSAPSVTLSADELRKEARGFQRRIGLRNLREYLAALFVLAAFARYFWVFPFPLMRIGSGLTILGTLVIMDQLRRRASRRPMPGENVGIPCLEFHRSELVRQRDALRSVWLWYIAPLVPGLVVFRLGVETELSASGPFFQGLLPNLVLVAILLCVAGLNFLVARLLQRRIDALDRVARNQD
jgi:hypothetical protein